MDITISISLWRLNLKSRTKPCLVSKNKKVRNFLKLCLAARPLCRLALGRCWWWCSLVSRPLASPSHSSWTWFSETLCYFCTIDGAFPADSVVRWRLGQRPHLEPHTHTRGAETGPGSGDATPGHSTYFTRRALGLDSRAYSSPRAPRVSRIPGIASAAHVP